MVEDIEAPSMELVEILGVVVAHEGALVEGEDYRVVESHGERLVNEDKVDGMVTMRRTPFFIISHCKGCSY